MKFPMNMELENGQIVKLRPITLSDNDQRHRFFIELSNAKVGIVHTPDELEIHSHQTQEKIHDFLLNKRGLWLIAIRDKDEVIGEVDITIKNLQKIRHVGKLTIGVAPNFQGLGLGKALMQVALEWAKQKYLLRIELNVFKSNQKAQNLYKRFGFVEEGVRKKFLRHKDNKFEDDILMAKYH